MTFKLVFSDQAERDLDALEADAGSAKKLKKVRKTLGLMETNLKHPSLNTHEYDSLAGANGEKVWEAYVENRTPGAFRVMWHYGPGKRIITVIAITPHP